MDMTKDSNSNIALKAVEYYWTHKEKGICVCAEIMGIDCETLIKWIAECGYSAKREISDKTAGMTELLEKFLCTGVGDYCKIKAGSYIVREGEDLQYLYWLLQGECVRKIFTYKGREFLLGTKASQNSVDSILGLFIIYNGENGVSHSNLIAKNDCECYRIPKIIFVEHVNNNPEILLEILYFASRERRKIIQTFLSMQEGNSTQVLCKLLIERLSSRKTFVKFTNVDIANTLGIHRITVGKIVNFLVAEDIIEKHGQKLKIKNLVKLESLAYGD